KVVGSTNALADLMWNKGTAHTGSMLAVQSVGNPIFKRSGSWAHDMNIYMFDDSEWCKNKYGSRIWGINNSWGNW
ncbi:hypothetical protein, partial [Enterococcus faecium]|uniref:hypothetical protein n=1 Tax=Enterococcus faecium TaxID=1352 RepID=UPI001EEAE11F